MSRRNPIALHRLIPIAVVTLLAAVALLALRGPLPIQRMFHPLRYQGLIADNARATRLDPHLVAALVYVESGFDESDVSPRGAVGLMQLMPGTASEVAREMGEPDEVTVQMLKRPDINIRLGTRHLATLQHRFGGRTEVALAAYNAGPVNALRWSRLASRTGRPFLEVVDFPETRRYVTDVLSQQGEYRALYPTAFE